MLEEINRVAREVQSEALELQNLRERQLQDESGPVELPVGATGGAAAPTPTPAPAPVPAP